MKRVITSIITILLIFSISCKKSNKSNQDEVLPKKYATVRIAVYKDKEMTKWLATLEKAEEVVFLAEEKLLDQKNNKTIEVAKVRLSDDSIGYMQSKYLADKPIVFVQESKLYIRPSITSKVFSTVPAGTVGFITGEKANWTEIFIGKMPDGKWIEGKWANEGFSDDLKLVIDASAYEKALNLISDSSKPENLEQAKVILKELSQKLNIIGELATAKLSEMEGGIISSAEKGESVEEVETSDINKTQ